MQNSSSAEKEKKTAEKPVSRLAALRKKRYEESKYQIPIPMRTYGVIPAPPMVVIFGPPSSGKSLLLNSIVRQCTKQKIDMIRGIISMVTSKTKRMSLYECPADLVSMVDASKIADLVILTIDASVGLEIETFEMLNLLRVHGFPKIACVITKLDSIKEGAQRRAFVKKIKKRMWTEICDGIKIFGMTRVIGGRYLDKEVCNLARFIVQMKYRPFMWRSAHPYIVVDQLQTKKDSEDSLSSNTDIDNMNQQKRKKLFTLTGYVRGGIAMNKKTIFHLPGIGDYRAESISVEDDPCPFTDSQKRKLSERKKPLYAPTSNIKGMMVNNGEIYLEVSAKPTRNVSTYNTSALPQPSFSLFADDPNRNIIISNDDTNNNITENDDNISVSNSITTSNEDTNTNNDKDNENGKDNELVDSQSYYSSEDSDGMTEEAVKRMFKRKEETEQEYIDKFNEEYKSEEKETRDILSQVKDRTKDAHEASMALLERCPEEERLHVEGIPPGRYVRVSMLLPEEVEEIYAPEKLFILGACKEEEMSYSFIQGRVKRHKWFKKTLRSREAHYVSMGWRRFQTVPVFSRKDAVRDKMLKYIPDSVTCNITFYGPICPPGTSFCLLRKLGENKNFRIAANGMQTEIEESPKIMKKLKLIGYPSEIKGHTVFVKDMFHTTQEAAEYEGALLKSVSGLRGQIKKAGENGVCRATFEGEMKMSDIIFLPCFVPISLLKVCLNAEIFRGAEEIRLLKEIREEKGLSLPQKNDSLYGEVKEPVLKKPRPIPTRLLSKAPLSMLIKEAEIIKQEPASEEMRAKVKALESIAEKANAIRQERLLQREQKIKSIIQERELTRKTKENRMKEKAKAEQRQPNKRHKKSKASKKQKK